MRFVSIQSSVHFFKPKAKTRYSIKSSADQLVGCRRLLNDWVWLNCERVCSLRYYRENKVVGRQVWNALLKYIVQGRSYRLDWNICSFHFCSFLHHRSQLRCISKIVARVESKVYGRNTHGSVRFLFENITEMSSSLQSIDLSYFCASKFYYSMRSSIKSKLQTIFMWL